MNNYELDTNEYCYTYTKYKKVMTWKAFKKFGWIKGQVLCEKYNIVLTGHRTRKEKFAYLFDKAVKGIKKGIKNKGKKQDYNKVFFGSKKSKSLDIFPKKKYDFKKMDRELLGIKKKVW